MNYDNTPTDSTLGKTTAYADQYDASLLFPIARAGKRAELNIGAGLAHESPPFFGADQWTAYEISWLNPKGKPCVALGEFVIPADSPCIIESKSFKLYLNSFNNTKLVNADALHSLLMHDLSEASGATVAVKLVLPDVGGIFAKPAFAEIETIQLADTDPRNAVPVSCLDRLDIECDSTRPTPEALRANHAEIAVHEILTSHLLKSNCLVTGQPDWGSLRIEYEGAQIEQAGLLQYIVSLRNHHEFHEQCVERIFMEIWTRCKPTRLSVYARYTRRGGLDINPFRTSSPGRMPPNVRSVRQ